jgi:trimeric autotransporter adhesin
MLASLRRIFCIFILGMLAACGGGGGGGGSAVPAPDPLPPGVTLVSISVGPQDTQVAKGLQHAFEATGIYSDNSKRDLSTQVVWASSDAAIVSVDASGLARTLGVGSAVISAVVGEISGSVVLQVTGATLLSIELVPAQLLLAKGVQQNLTATGVYSDNSTDDLSLSVVWTVSDAAVAAVSPQGAVLALNPGNTVVRASLNGVVGSSLLTVGSAALLAIDVTPDAPRLSKGTQVDVVATGVYSDASTQDLSALVVWTSSAPEVATVVATAALAKQPGQAMLTATLGEMSGTTVLTVTAATLVALQVEPTQAQIAKGTQQAFTATGVYTDNSSQNLTAQVVWSSQDGRIASIGNSGDESGFAVGRQVGTAAVNASLGGVSDTAQLQVTSANLVSIELNPMDPSLAQGTQINLVATGLFSDSTQQDLSTQVAWSSSNSLVAAVSHTDPSAGTLTALGQGSATITAASGAVTQSTSVQVTPATLVSLELSPITLQLPRGTQRTLVATGVYSDSSTHDVSDQVTWRSSNEQVAAISSAQDSPGLVTAISRGEVSISATAVGGVSASSALSVTNAQLISIAISPADTDVSSLAKGVRIPFVATGLYTDNSTQNLTHAVVWSSSNARVMAVTNDDSAGFKGWVRAVGVGSATLSAGLEGVQASTPITVNQAALVSVQITGEDFTGELPQGLAQRITAVGVYTDQSRQTLTGNVIWSSRNPQVASISNADKSAGLLQARAQGTTTLRATAQGLTGSVELVVTPGVLRSLALTVPSATLAAGISQQIMATGLFSDGAVRKLTDQVVWTSSRPFNLGVGNAPGSKGLATGIYANDDAVVSASMGEISASARVQVTPAQLVSIEVSPGASKLPKGSKSVFKATALYTDNTTLDVTRFVSWSASNAAILSLSHTDDAAGTVKAIAQGQADLLANLRNVTGSTQVSVTPAAINTNIALSLSSSTGPIPVPMRTNMEIQAQAGYTDNSVHDVTAIGRWSSSHSSIASVEKTAGGKAVIYAKSPGRATISVQIDERSSALEVNVVNAVPVSLQALPITLNINKGTTHPFTAVATYNDGSFREVSSQVVWTVGDTSVATITQPTTAGDKGGVLSALKVGNTTVQGKFQNINSQVVPVAVPAPTLDALTVTPVDEVFYPIFDGSSVYFDYRAVGRYSDGSTQDLTKYVTWVSEDKDWLSITNEGSNKGQAHANRFNAFECYHTGIKASLGGISARVPARVKGSLSGC